MVWGGNVPTTSNACINSVAGSWRHVWACWPVMSALSVQRCQQMQVHASLLNSVGRVVGCRKSSHRPVAGSTPAVGNYLFLYWPPHTNDTDNSSPRHRSLSAQQKSDLWPIVSAFLLSTNHNQQNHIRLAAIYIRRIAFSLCVFRGHH